MSSLAIDSPLRAMSCAIRRTTRRGPTTRRIAGTASRATGSCTPDSVRTCRTRARGGCTRTPIDRTCEAANGIEDSECGPRSSCRRDRSRCRSHRRAHRLACGTDVDPPRMRSSCSGRERARLERLSLYASTVPGCCSWRLRREGRSPDTSSFVRSIEASGGRLRRCSSPTRARGQGPRRVFALRDGLERTARPRGRIARRIARGRRG